MVELLLTLMQLLDSILANIGDKPADGPSPKPATSNGSFANQAATRPRPVQNAASTPKLGEKRKAENSLASSAAKVPRPNRLEGIASGGNERPNLARAQSSNGTTRLPMNTSTTKPSSMIKNSSAQVSSAKSGQIAKAPAKALPQPSSMPSTAPKKGSFADILARGKKLQESSANFGVLQHKRTEKDPRKRTGQKIDLKSKKPQVASTSGTKASLKSGETKSSNDRLSQPKPKPAEPSYKGTMRPSKPESTYRGTMNLAPGPKKSASSLARPGGGRRGPVEYYSDEEDEDEMDDYESDVSSDMEAGHFDVELEDEAALRIARAEDAREKQLEDELKRQKADKKRTLDRLAAAAKAKKRI